MSIKNTLGCVLTEYKQSRVENNITDSRASYHVDCSPSLNISCAFDYRNLIHFCKPPSSLFEAGIFHLSNGPRSKLKALHTYHWHLSVLLDVISRVAVVFVSDIVTRLTVILLRAKSRYFMN